MCHWQIFGRLSKWTRIQTCRGDWSLHLIPKTYQSLQSLGNYWAKKRYGPGQFLPVFLIYTLFCIVVQKVPFINTGVCAGVFRLPISMGNQVSTNNLANKGWSNLNDFNNGPPWNFNFGAGMTQLTLWEQPILVNFGLFRPNLQGYLSATRGTFKPKTPPNFPLDDPKLLQFGDLERPKMDQIYSSFVNRGIILRQNMRKNRMKISFYSWRNSMLIVEVEFGVQRNFPILLSHF